MPETKDEEYYYFSRIFVGALFVGGIYLFAKGVSS